jgi:hypothetical protein
MALNAKTFMLERVSTPGTRLPEEKSFHFAVTHLRITNLAKWQQARARANGHFYGFVRGGLLLSVRAVRPQGRKARPRHKGRTKILKFLYGGA